MPKTCLATILLLFASLTLAAGHSYKTDGLMIGHLWAKPADLGETAHVFAPIVNQGPQADVLIKAETPVANRAELWLDRDGTARVDQLILPPKSVLTLRPGSRSIRLIGLRQPLVSGSKFPLTLTFKNAGPVPVEIYVENAPYAGGPPS